MVDRSFEFSGPFPPPRGRTYAGAPSRFTCAAFAMLHVVLAGCSVLVDPVAENDVLCEVVDGEDPCEGLGKGFHCSPQGRCEGCTQQPEACDGVDNDCDGLVDEGHDQDRDGVTWCGEGVLDYRDCDDNAAAVYPAVGRREAAPELCDGKDNDCDGVYDEGSGCQSQNCLTEGCPGNTRCDARSGRCIGPRSLGGECSSDAECGSDFCIDSELLLLPRSVGARVCARACCRDEDCPEYTFCAVGADGVRACVPSLDGERQPAGSPCLDAASCGSLSCVRRECADPCARASDCEGDLCSLGGGAGAPFRASWRCGQAAGVGEVGELCSPWDLLACKTGFCLDGTCVEPCGTDTDCGLGMRCDYRSAAGGLFASPAWLPVCVAVAEARLETACCNNSACSGEFAACRPVLESTHWSMRCASER